MKFCALTVLWVSFAAFAQPSPDEMAKIQRDIDKATADVDKKYTGKQLSPEERKQQIKDKAAAERAVLEKAGVDAKEWARATAKQSKDDRAAQKAAAEKLEKQDKAAAGGGEKGNEIVIERGGTGQMSDEDEAKAADKAAGYGKTKKKGK